MFGQEPRLPVDFLLGQVPEPVGGEPHEWIQENQAWLQVAFEGAQGRLRVAVERRKWNYDRHVRDVPLTEGQLVWLRDLTVRGRNKIQDRWGPVVYRVVRAPIGGGSVYTIAPVDDPTKARQVNRTLLKAVVGAAPQEAALAPCSPQFDSPQSEGELSCGTDLFLWEQEPPPAAAVTQTTSRLALLLGQQTVLPGVGESAVRRTT